MKAKAAWVVVERKGLVHRGLESFDTEEEAQEFLDEMEGRNASGGEVSYVLEEVQVTEPRKVKKPTKKERDAV